MSRYLGDYFSGCSVYGMFTTINGGVPTALTGNPAPFLVVYRDAYFGTCSRVGVVQAFDCTGATGLNAFEITTNASPAFYACGHDYQVIVNGGTVGGACASGYVVASFSLDNRSALRPTIHGVTSACTSIFSTKSVENSVTVDPCTSIFSVHSVDNAVLVGDKTGFALAAGGVGIPSGAHAAAELNAIADALLDRNMATGADSGTDSTVTRTVRQALRRLRNKEAIVAGTGTVRKEDDATASWTYAATTAAGDPLSAVDPS